VETLLLLHGWGGDSNSFAPLIPFLKLHFHLITPSMPMDPTQVMTLDDYADLVEQELIDVESCHILAHSFGCRVATILVSRNPKRFKKLVFTGAAGIPKSKSIKTKVKIRLHKLGFKQKGSPEYQVLSKEGKITFQNIINRDLSPEISRITNNTLLIFGSRDKSTPVTLGKRWAQLSKNSNLIIYKDVGHFAYLDQTSRFLRDTMVFFRR